RRPRTRCGTAGCTSACRTRSRATSAGSGRSATASAPAFQAHVCDRRDAGPADSPRGKCAAASCGWASCPPAPADSPDGDSRTGGVPPPARADASARAHHRLPSADTGSPGGSRRQDCTPDARSARDAYEHERRLPA
ncbi:hypothetical protein QU38_02310, partial [Staphylococcus aureus]